MRALGSALSILMLCGLLVASTVLPAQAQEPVDPSTSEENAVSTTETDSVDQTSGDEEQDSQTSGDEEQDSVTSSDSAEESTDSGRDGSQNTPVTTSGSDFSFCVPDNTVVYANTASGQVAQYPSGNLQPGWSALSGIEEVNALGIAPGGETAYAIERAEANREGAFKSILKYENGTYSRVDDSGVGDFGPVSLGGGFPPGSVLTGSNNQPALVPATIVAGAVSPNNGNYYFGGFERVKYRVGPEGSPHYMRYTLVYFEYNPASDELIGPKRALLTDLLLENSSDYPTNNGDFAFDSDGNLFILSGTDQQDSAGNPVAYYNNAHVYRIDHQSLQGSSPTAAQVSMTEITGNGHNPRMGLANGIAFNGAGNLVMSVGNGPYYAREYRSQNGVWSLVSSTTTTIAATDLSSCLPPSTLTIQKYVTERANDSDQFVLSVAGSQGGTAFEEATTTGSATGIQAEKIGPTIVGQGEDYYFSEAGSNGTDLDDYTSSYECVNSSTNATLSSGDGTSGHVTIPDNQPGVSVVCTFTNTPKSSGYDMCNVSELYGLTQNGRVWSAEESTGATAPVGSWASLYDNWNVTPGTAEEWKRDGVNGLAIAQDGTMYAYARGYMKRPDLGTNFNLRIRLLKKEPGGSWEWYSNTTYPYSYENTSLPVAGAIDPKTGHYVWGGFRDGNFVIREINLDTGTSYVTGRVDVGSGAVNGDIAFDDDGNLYIVGQGSGQLHVTTVTAAELAAKRTEGGGYDSWPSTITNGTTVSSNYDSQVNGVAVGEHGDLYVSTTRYIYKVNPLSGALVLQDPVAENPHYTGSSASHQNGFNTDMASCASNSPTTLTVQKDLRDGGESDDKFDLTVELDGNEVASTTAETRVNGTTVLAEKTGPTWVQVGSELDLTEESANLSDYDSELTCRIDGVDGVAGEVEVDGDATTSGSVTIPASAAGKNVTCTFTNTPVQTGEVIWQKVDNQGNHLRGSVWTITDEDGVEVEIKDCVEEDSATCADAEDKDHRAGYFKVTELAPGTYTLTEKSAPAGYLVGDFEETFEIGQGGSAALEIDLEEFVNHQKPGPILPLTGGLGTHLFLIIGGGFLVLLIAAATYRQYLQRRTRKVALATA